jgi:hypothetical protein
MTPHRIAPLMIAALGSATAACSGSDDGSQAPPDDDGMQVMMPPPESEPEGPAMDECGLDTLYPGDEVCILPPPEGEGFQLYYGPGGDYDDPDAVAPYLVDGYADVEVNAPVTSGNTEAVYYFKRQYRMRPGSHHLIVFESGGAGSFFGGGRRLGGSQNTVKDNPAGEVPPENEGIGMPLAANASIILNLHHFNGTPDPILKEVWVNFWYVDGDAVTKEAREMFLWAQGGSVQPGASATADATLTITEPGRILTAYGHRHANNVRFSAWRRRGDARDLAIEDYDWEEPAVLEFNSITTNAPPDSSTFTPGGHTGILDLAPGDVIEWECEVVNNNDFTISFGQNEAVNSEMCILVGDAIGPQLMNFSF